MEIATDDGEQASGPFLRVRLRWPVRQPLVYTLPVVRKERVTKHNIRYEHVPNFCFFCGRIGHARKECKLEIVPHPGRRSGPELRVSPFKMFDARRFTVKGKKPMVVRKLFPDEDESSFVSSAKSSGRNTPVELRTQSPVHDRAGRRHPSPASPEEQSAEAKENEGNMQDELAQDMQERLCVRDSPAKSMHHHPGRTSQGKQSRLRKLRKRR
jgi:hypothetical protein